MARKKKPWKYARVQAYHQAHPWVKYVCWARRRCSDRNSKWFKYYGANGITCELTAAQAKVLWERDKAESMEKASLDRIQSNLGYTVENCRFIEFKDNSRLSWDKGFKFLGNGDAPLAQEYQEEGEQAE